jgi:hypothetical protein
MRRTATAFLVAALLSASPALAADPAPAALPGGSSLVGWGILGWGSAIGLGASFQLPLAPKGLIHDPGFKLRDSLDLDMGLDWLSYWDTHYAGPYAYDVAELDLHAGLIWNFWLTPQVAVYPKAGLGYAFAHYSYSPGYPPGYGHTEYGGLYPELAVGGLVNLSRTVSLRGELGWAGLKIGVGFAF